MDIFDIDGGIGDGVQLLETALPAVVPAGATPPQYSRFLPAGWRDHQRTRQAAHDRMRALERTGARLFVERLRLERRPGWHLMQVMCSRLPYATSLSLEQGPGPDQAGRQGGVTRPSGKRYFQFWRPAPVNVRFVQDRTSLTHRSSEPRRPPE